MDGGARFSPGRSRVQPGEPPTRLGVPGGTRPAAHKLSASLWLITADVPLETYGPPQLESRLRDLDWVSQVALAHEAVVEYRHAADAWPWAYRATQRFALAPTSLSIALTLRNESAASMPAGLG